MVDKLIARVLRVLQSTYFIFVDELMMMMMRGSVVFVRSPTF